MKYMWTIKYYQIGDDYKIESKILIVGDNMSKVMEVFATLNLASEGIVSIERGSLVKASFSFKRDD